MNKKIIKHIEEAIEKEIGDSIKSKIADDLKDSDDLPKSVLNKLKNHCMFKKKSLQPWLEHSKLNPFVKIILARSGLLPLYVLHLLQTKDMFGNEIMNEIEKRTHFAWSHNPGAVYPLLKEFEKEKLVECSWDLEEKHPRKIYIITEKGKKEYEIVRKILKNKIKRSLSIFNEMFNDIFEEKKSKKERNEKR